MFRDRFWVSLLLTIPTLVWEPMIQQWFGYTAPQFPGSQFMQPVFGAIVFFYGGWVFIEGAWRELRARLPGMMTLISLAISVAFLYSLAVTLGLTGHPLWWELATLVTIMLLGHWIEMRSISQAQGALKELAKLLPDVALRVTERPSPLGQGWNIEPGWAFWLRKRELRRMGRWNITPRPTASVVSPDLRRYPCQTELEHPE